MTVKGNTGKGGVSYNDLLAQNHRLQDEAKEAARTADGLVNEVEQERARNVEMVDQLHRAVHGTRWAATEPEQVWESLLQRVRAMRDPAIEDALNGHGTRS